MVRGPSALPRGRLLTSSARPSRPGRGGRPSGRRRRSPPPLAGWRRPSATASRGSGPGRARTGPWVAGSGCLATPRPWRFWTPWASSPGSPNLPSPLWKQRAGAGAPADTGATGKADFQDKLSRQRTRGAGPARRGSGRKSLFSPLSSNLSQGWGV